MNVNIALLSISLIAIFGFISETLFRRTNVPDVIFLIVIGFLIGPNGYGFTSPEDLASIAPVITTFTLLILIFELCQSHQTFPQTQSKNQSLYSQP